MSMDIDPEDFEKLICAAMFFLESRGFLLTTRPDKPCSVFLIVYLFKTAIF